jgi:hypothetical protein
MAKQSERIPVNDQYLHALGRAAYNFAYLEWGIVWLTETIQFGFLNEVRNLTAGQIANRFSQAADGLADDDPNKSALQSLAHSFSDLVEERNRLMHGNPFTAEGGEQRLLYDGRHGRKDWTVALIDKFSEQTAIASIEAGRLLHGGLLANYQHNHAG